MATSVTLTRRFEAPPERVFDVATSLRDAERTFGAITRMEVLTDGPVGVGTRFRETRIVFKREATEEMEVVRFDRPRAWSFLCESHGCLYRTEYELAVAGGGTELRLTFEATPRTFAARVLGFLFGFLLKSCAREMEKDLDDLARALEGERAEGGEPAPTPA